MRRVTILTITMVALTSFMAITAVAQNPHFQNCSATLNNNGSLTVPFRIAGLGNNEQLTITATATANATYGCLNRGAQCPNAANKINVQTNVSATGTFKSDKNGAIDDFLTVSPPPPPTGFSCPGNQKVVLISITYTNVTVSGGGDTCQTSPPDLNANFFPQCP
jgi:hypothetical protein